jgi:hypothetical protein
MDTGRFEVGVYEHGRAVGIASMHDAPLAALDAAARLNAEPHIAGGLYLAQPAGTVFLDAFAQAATDGRRPYDVLHDFDIEFDEAMAHGTAAHAALHAMDRAAAECGCSPERVLTGEVPAETLAFILRLAPSYLPTAPEAASRCRRLDTRR